MPKSNMDESVFIFRNRPFIPLELTQSIDLVDENVYLGDLAAATNESLLDSLGVRRILTLDLKPLPPHMNEKYTCSFIYALDQEDADLLTHFDDAVQFINDIQPNEKVLVHCYFGVSRSATIMTAYIMHKHHLPADEALNFVKERRRMACPNAGFVAQLHLYFLMNWQLDDNNLQYRLYKLYNTARKIQKEKSFVDVMNTYVDDEVTPFDLYYKCKKCRKPLFSGNSVFPHDLGKMLHWNLDIYTMSNPICDKGLLIRPLPWMNEAKENLSGKLYCRHCSAKIGSFDWQGSKCPCGARVEPTFFIAMDRIDEVPPSREREQTE